MGDEGCRPEDGHLMDKRVNMQNELTFVRRGVLSALDLAAGTRVCVVGGRVWLTEEGLAEDFVLSPRDEHIVVNGGRVLVDVVDASDEACLRLVVPKMLKEAA